MSKTKRIITIILIVIAWIYLIYKLLVFDDYQNLFDSLSALPISNYLYLMFALLLMPLNIFLEISKWHISVNKVLVQSFSSSVRQVFFGNAGAFITPYRLGEYPNRAYYIEDKSLALSAVVIGFLGTIALEIINIGVGLVSSILYFNEDKANIVLFYLMVLILFILIFVYIPRLCKYVKNKKINNSNIDILVNNLSELDSEFLIKILFLSLARYIVYCLQFYLVLLFFSVDISSIQALIYIPIYYMFVSISPSIPIADVAVRGSWAIFVFQNLTDSLPLIAFSAMILWLINTILPLLMALFIKK